jgi:hypothetical protein
VLSERVRKADLRFASWRMERGPFGKNSPVGSDDPGQ